MLYPWWSGRVLGLTGRRIGWLLFAVSGRSSAWLTEKSGGLVDWSIDGRWGITHGHRMATHLRIERNKTQSEAQIWNADKSHLEIAKQRCTANRFEDWLPLAASGRLLSVALADAQAAHLARGSRQLADCLKNMLTKSYLNSFQSAIRSVRD